ncbi:MAG: VWA-like domain-containing protein [Humibacillus sp.]|nr:VWA-like domain-containing protein [Humibacillus sp.]MDN5778830.1 VWA-like domain-containing protein [Humibacillus sp.]
MVTVRPLTRDEQLAYSGALIRALEMVPYFAAALLRMRAVAADGLGTAAIDKHWRLYLDPATTSEWGPVTTAAVLAHETGHVLRRHAERADALGVSDHATWNIATDAAINEDLLRCHVPLPDSVVTPENQNLPANGVEEDYYNELISQQAASQSAPGGDTGQAGPSRPADDVGCGSGAGDPTPTWELPAADATTPGIDPVRQDSIRKIVADAVRESAAKNPGTLPAGLTRWAEQTLTPATVNWRKQLRATIRHAAAWVTGDQEYTYRRPGRRRITDVITPAMQSPRPQVAVVIDTSGSMSPTDLRAALSEVSGITRALGARLNVITVDTEAHVQTNIANTEQIILTGGGGTDMRVGIEAARASLPAPNLIVLLTDGFTPYPDRPGREALVVGIIGPTLVPTPDWAGTVHIPT